MRCLSWPLPYPLALEALKPIFTAAGESLFWDRVPCERGEAEEPNHSCSQRDHKVQICLSGVDSRSGFALVYAVSEITRGVYFE